MGNYYDKAHEEVILKAHAEIDARERAEREARRRDQRAESARSEAPGKLHPRSLSGQPRARHIYDKTWGARQDTEAYRHALNTWKATKDSSALMTVMQPAIEKAREWNQGAEGESLAEEFVDYVVRAVYMQFQCPRLATWISKREVEQDIKTIIAPVKGDYTVEWLWPGRFIVRDSDGRGAFQMILGESHIGKSTLAHYIAAKVSVGGAWPYNEGIAPRGNVLFLVGDNVSAGLVHGRVRFFQGDEACVRVIERRDMPPLNYVLGQSKLKQLIREVQPVIVIIDPLEDFYGALEKEKVPSLDKREGAMALLDPLETITQLARLSFLFTWQFNKAGDYFGAGEFYTRARAVQSLSWTLHPRGASNRIYTPRLLDEKKFQLEVKRTIRREPLVWLPESAGYAWRYANPTEKADKEAREARALLGLMRKYNGDASPEVIREEWARLDFKEYRLKPLRKKLGIAAIQVRDRLGGKFTGWRWVSPDDQREPEGIQRK